MGDKKQASEIIREIREGERVLTNQRPRQSLVPFYLQLLEEPHDDEVLMVLRYSLRDEYLLHNEFEAAAAIALEEIARRPNHPMPLLILAGQKHHSEGDPQAALPFALKAVVLADGVREWRRHARATLLRVAGDLGDVELVRACMVEIVDLELAPGEPDVGREADLLKLAKRVGVEEQILDRYRNFVRYPTGAITTRPATVSDANFILKLEALCMRKHAEALWGTWRPSASAETLDVAGHEIIEVAGHLAGCVAVTWHDDHLFVDKLYIHPDRQGHGAGAIILERKVSEAAARKLPTVLSVLTTNPADSFYRREGFAIVSETTERRRMMKSIEG
jgi:N-acetylglutamate synthase-like GNAT family acetyltransferase